MRHMGNYFRYIPPRIYTHTYIAVSADKIFPRAFVSAITLLCDIYICICIYARIHARDFPRTINHGRRRVPGRGGERRRWWKKRERVETRGINDPLKIIPAYSTGYQPALLLSRNVWRIDQNPVQSIALLYPDTNRITVG